MSASPNVHESTTCHGIRTLYPINDPCSAISARWASFSSLQRHVIYTIHVGQMLAKADRSTPSKVSCPMANWRFSWRNSQKRPYDMADMNLNLFGIYSMTNNIKKTISLQSCRYGVHELWPVCFEQRQVHSQNVSPFKWRLCRFWRFPIRYVREFYSCFQWGCVWHWSENIVNSSP